MAASDQEVIYLDTPAAAAAAAAASAPGPASAATSAVSPRTPPTERASQSSFSLPEKLLSPTTTPTTARRRKRKASGGRQICCQQPTSVFSRAIERTSERPMDPPAEGLARYRGYSGDRASSNWARPTAEPPSPREVAVNCKEVRSPLQLPAYDDERGPTNSPGKFRALCRRRRGRRGDRPFPFIRGEHRSPRCARMECTRRRHLKGLCMAARLLRKGPIERRLSLGRRPILYCPIQGPAAISVTAKKARTEEARRNLLT